MAQAHVQLQLLDDGEEFRRAAGGRLLEAGPVVQQFDDGDVLPFLLQVDGGFHAHGAGAHHHHLLAAGLLPCVRLGGPDHVRQVDARQLRDDGLRPDGHDDGVVILLLQHLPGGLGVQQDLRPAFIGLALQVLQIIRHVLLEGGQGGVLQLAAQLPRLLIQGHVVAPHAQDLGSGDAAGAAADDGHLPLGIRLLHPAQGEFPLPAQEGVHGAGDDPVLRRGAALAPEAGPVVLLPALGVLPGHFRVRQEGTAHGDKVRLAGGDDLLRPVDAHDAAHGVDEQVGELLLDGGGVMDVELPVHHVVLPPVLHVLELPVDARGDMEDIDLVLDQGDVLQGLLIAHAAGLDLVRADPGLDDEVLPAELPHPVQDLDGEAGPVLQAAAVFVRPVVVQGAGELADEVGVAAVDHGHAHPGLLGPEGGLGVFLHGLVDMLHRHLNGLDRLPAHLLRAHELPGGIIGAGGVGGLAGAGELAVLPPVVDLQGGVGAHALAHEGELAQGHDAVVAAQVQLPLLVLAFRNIHHHVAHGDDGSAAPGDAPVQIHEFLRHQMVRAAQVQRGGSQLDAVLEVHPPDADGGEYMGILGTHWRFLSPGRSRSFIFRF